LVQTAGHQPPGAQFHTDFAMARFLQLRSSAFRGVAKNTRTLQDKGIAIQGSFVAKCTS
jgi:hypothetical protein